MLIHQLSKKFNLTSLKSDVDKLEKAPHDLSSLKSKVDQLDIGKFETTPVDFSKLSNAVKNNAVKNKKTWWIDWRSWWCSDYYY